MYYLKVLVNALMNYVSNGILTEWNEEDSN